MEDYYLARTEGGVCFISTPQANLEFPQANLKLAGVCGVDSMHLINK